MATTIQVGDRVRKTGFHDGTAMAGRPIGEILIVTEVFQHRPVDGPPGDMMARLSDGTCEYTFNLHEMKYDHLRFLGGGER